ncbi:zinc-ribbon domain-containing protein [Scytonema sp. UIC 10036]|uniref:PP2C family serine/threonine-protein phosphatase n=1 Tax=Scytonema sp. UIC 10036 TaxID=2304196 RepID=UPI0012DA530F|nr:protein phosphatase 2C domain-containing protein [Scytonema sp. UIC 10036]MUG98201.1 zinc-ribbon domain-containing protein [Scytonema sp. UIC 10036]
MKCSKCGNTIEIGDRFCEECGTPAMPKATGGCEKCGASVEEIDPEGFCSQCGFRQEIQQTNNFEILLSPNLAGVSHRGLKHHRNEDYLACARVGTSVYVLVVCDGVSSSASPDLAAKVAAESACRALERGVRGTNLQKEIKLAIAEAMTAVSAIPYNVTTDIDPPSTTIVAAVVVDNTATIAWLGDSRAYWISPNSSRQLTRDHSWFYDVVLSGEMTESEAKKSPHVHAITRWLGADAGNVEPSIVNFEIPGYGYLLLCTDGLWNYTPEVSELQMLVNPDIDAITVAQKLIEFACLSGGHDNITVAVLSLRRKK